MKIKNMFSFLGVPDKISHFCFRYMDQGGQNDPFLLQE